MRKISTSVFNFFDYKISNLAEIEKNKLLWIIKMRWCFILIQALLIIPYFLINYRIYKIANYVGICIFLIFFNLIALGILKNIKKEIHSIFNFINLTIDLLAIAALVSFVQKELYFNIDLILFINVIIGAILLNKVQSRFHYLIAAFLLFSLNNYNFYFAPENKIKIIAYNQAILFFMWIVIRLALSFIDEQRNYIEKLKLDFEKNSRLKALGALTAGFSHEFSSPLTTIKLRMNRINRKKIVELEDISETMRAVDECEKIIKQINYSQLDNRDLLFKEVDVVKFLEDLVVSWKIEHRNIEIELISNVSNCFMLMPYMSFSQSVINILDNSSQSLSVNKITLKIMIDERFINLIVLDNGEGFSEHVLNQFGDPFITTKDRGTGLGLYTTNLFVQSIGGDFSISNHHNGGALVKIKIPRILERKKDI